MSLESLHVSYNISRSISLERAGENDKPSHPPLNIVTMHPDFFTHVVRLIFRHFLRCLATSNVPCSITSNCMVCYDRHVHPMETKKPPWPYFPTISTFFTNWWPSSILIRVLLLRVSITCAPGLSFLFSLYKRNLLGGLGKTHDFLLVETESLGNLVI